MKMCKNIDVEDIPGKWCEGCTHIKCEYNREMYIRRQNEIDYSQIAPENSESFKESTTK